MMRKNPILFALCLFAVVQLATAEEVQFRVLEDTPVWRTGMNAPMTDANADRIIPKGSLVSNAGRGASSYINGKPAIYGYIIFENTKYIVPANIFTAADTVDIFGEPFLSNSDPQEETTWVNSYFLAVLKNGDRDVLMPYEQRIVDEFSHYEMGDWYDFSGWDSSFITQSTISIGGFAQDSFLIRRIERISNGYCVTVMWDTSVSPYMSVERRSTAVNLPARDEASVFDFYFITDGDYLDVYYTTAPDGSGRVFSSSFVRADAEIRKQLGGIIRYNPLSSMPVPFYPERLTFWPRRADGSTDFSPPEGANLAFQAGDEKRGELAAPIRPRDLQHSFCSYKTNVARVFGYAKNRTLSPH